MFVNRPKLTMEQLDPPFSCAVHSAQMSHSQLIQVTSEILTVFEITSFVKGYVLLIMITYYHPSKLNCRFPVY